MPACDTGRRALLAAGLLGAAGVTASSLAASPSSPDVPPGRWLDPAGRPSAAAIEALALLADAASDGLNPADYATRELSASATALRTRFEPADAERFEQALDASLLRYLHDLHAGRVDPQALGFRVSPRRTNGEVAALLRQVLAMGPRQAAQQLAPTLAAYRQLRSALARYRELAADATLAAPPALARTLQRGDSDAALPALRRWLHALGDLPAEGAAPGEDLSVFDPALAGAVQRFQRRHGLTADGVIGRTTRAALGVPLAQRVQQVELAMERLRWLPPIGERPFVAINIPMFRLWAREPGGPLIDMAVIVGKAFNTQTPVFADEMTHLIFRPYWNVPRSIVRGEIMPALRRDPAYLERHDMEIVQGAGDDAHAVAATAQSLELLAQGALRLRQRPGAENSLGLVKFVFPNDANVYMHGTPAPRLFAQTRRDFSHGCVRLEDPVALAQWALRDQPQWTRERIVAAMNGARSVRVELTRPVQVLLYYVTAAVMPADGALHFADDIYGHDKKLAAALAARRPA